MGASLEGYWPLLIEKLAVATANVYTKHVIPRGTTFLVQSDDDVHLMFSREFLWGGSFGASWRDIHGLSAPLAVDKIFASDTQDAVFSTDQDIWNTTVTTNAPNLEKTSPTDGKYALEFSLADADDEFEAKIGAYYQRGDKLVWRSLPANVDMNLLMRYINTGAATFDWTIEASGQGAAVPVAYWNDNSGGWVASRTDALAANASADHATLTTVNLTWTTHATLEKTYKLIIKPTTDSANTVDWTNIGVSWAMGNLAGAEYAANEPHIFTAPFDLRVGADSGGTANVYVSELRRI
jgi:hypothetical protein